MIKGLVTMRGQQRAGLGSLSTGREVREEHGTLRVPPQEAGLGGCPADLRAVPVRGEVTTGAAAAGRSRFAYVRRRCPQSPAAGR